jgi:glycosyltransferase involved in cell wall biosynthesis
MHTILFPVNALKIGGAEQQLLELVRGLDKSRYRPIVASLNRGAPLDAEFASVPGAEVVHLDRRGKYDASPFWKIASLLRSERVEIIQPFLSPATLFGLLPALGVGTPVRIVTERCGVRRYRHLGYHLYRTAEDMLARFANVVVANSEAGRDLMLQRGIAPAKVRVIYNGINFDRLEPDDGAVAEIRGRLGVPPGATVVGILASLSPAKDHDTFLRAAARIVEQRPDTRFAVIGDGALRTDLEARAVELGVAGRVTFFGFQRRVADYLAACDVVMSSSRDNEGCSNSILEAMALGRPVIATDVGGNRELVAHGATGYLVPVGDHLAFAAMFDRLMTAPQERAAIVAQARQMIDQQFSLRGMVSQYETLYEALLDRGLPTGAARAAFMGGESGA